MKIQQIFFKNTLRNFAYLITFDDGTIYCIDPFNHSEIIEALAEKKATKLSGIINTHDHCDHYSGNDELVRRFSCPVYAHKEASVPGKTNDLVDRDIIYSAGEWSLVGLFTPGHTMSHLCVLVEKSGAPYVLFTGDCFFNAGVGNCHNGGNVEVLYETITKTFGALADEVIIYPGHEYLKRNLEFTLSVEADNQEANEFLKKVIKIDSDKVFFVNSMKTERKINSFLRLKSSSLRSGLKLLEASDKEVFIKLRELRNRW